MVEAESFEPYPSELWLTLCRHKPIGGAPKIPLVSMTIRRSWRTPNIELLVVPQA